MHRLGVTLNASGASSYPGASSPSIHTRGGVTSAGDLSKSLRTDAWSKVPNVEHNPMAIMSEADALAKGYVIVKPATGGGSVPGVR